MPTLELSDNDAALILSEDAVEVFLPESMERADDGDGKWSADAKDHPHAIIVWALATLLDDDEEFVSYILDRQVEIQNRNVESLEEDVEP